MSSPLLVLCPGAPEMGEALASAMGAEIAQMNFRRFPDGEQYLRYLTDPADRDVVLLCGLTPPDGQISGAIFAADAARNLGARSVGLVAPYLPYMRQDIRFSPGEAVTSISYAKLISAAVDWMVTVDPHLHRWKHLDELYSIPTRAVSAMAGLADWIAAHVRAPLIIGPDAESEQWIRRVAESVRAPHAVCTKTRRGDRDVVLMVPDLSGWAACTPVIVDDTISTATTMSDLVKMITGQFKAQTICCAVHGLFCGDAFEQLQASGPAQIITSNTVPHVTNTIDLSSAIAAAARDLLAVAKSF